MKPTILRIDQTNAALLAQVDPDVFDEDLRPEALAAFLAQTNHLLVIALEDALVVGQVRAIVHHQPDNAPNLYIDNLGVAPAFQRRGIATALLREAFAWGRDHGCTDAWVATETDNAPARALYDRLASEPSSEVAYFVLNIDALG